MDREQSTSSIASMRFSESIFGSLRNPNIIAEARRSSFVLVRSIRRERYERGREAASSELGSSSELVSG